MGHQRSFLPSLNNVLLALLFLCSFAHALGPHRVAIATMTSSGNRCTENSLNYEFHQRQYNVRSWFDAATQSRITLNNAVATLRDVFTVVAPASGSVSGCQAWHNLFKSQLPGAAATAQYDSYIWIVSPSFNLAGCTNSETETLTANAQLGPCVGGCYNFFTDCPTVTSAVYALGRNMGLKRSHGRVSPSSTAIVPNADYSCPMGSVFDARMSEGIQRRAFNAIKLRDLGLVTALETSTLTLPATQLLSAPYVFDQVLGRVRLMHITGTPYYLSYRSPIDFGVDRNINFAARFTSAPRLTSITGNIHVHEVASDGSSILVAAIASGSTLSLPYQGTTYTIRNFWITNDEVMVGFSNNANLPVSPPIPAAVIPDSATIWVQTKILDAAEQGSLATDTAYSASALLNLHWAGDDRNSTVFVRISLPIPRAATIQSAVLFFESDAQQLAGFAGTTQSIISLESTDNAPSYSGNVNTRSTFSPSIPFVFQGDWETADEIPVDVTTLITAATSRLGWQPGNFVSLRFRSAIVAQAASRTVKSGVSCTTYGATTPCAPRIKIKYTSSGGQPTPTPVPCAFVWSEWSQCTGGVCNGQGTQFRTLIITQQAANGGTACPTTTRQEQACPRESCVTVPPAAPVNCVVSYGSWSICNGPCGSSGSQTRSLTIVTQAANGGLACPVSLVETRQCQTVACPPVDCVKIWGALSPCVGECGRIGTQNRTATILTQPQNGGAPCGTLQESFACQMPACIQDCVVTFGSQWSNCERICACPCASGSNAGVQQLVGTVTQPQIGLGKPCPSTTMTRSCTASPCAPVDCQFVWSDWSACVGTCGSTGTQSRFATIYSQPLNGGAQCPSPSTQSRSCATAPCNAGVTSFPFIQSVAAGSVVGSISNLGTKDFQYVTITENQRNLDVSWLFYPPASGELDLEVTIGATNLQGQTLILSWGFSGSTLSDVLIVRDPAVRTYKVVISSVPTSRRVVQVRIRNSDPNTFRAVDTKALVDYLAIVSFESTGPTPVDCVQTALAIEGPCSTQCGTGTQCFRRQTLVAAANGGRPCEPERVCSACNDVTACRVDCVISAFGPPSVCSATCSFGFSTSTATVLVPPANGGAPCPSLTKTTLCYAGSCRAVQDCLWGSWGPWSPCSAPCGGGTQTQTRVVATPATGGGAACTGPTSQTQTCNTQSCAGNVQLVTVRSQRTVVNGLAHQLWPSTAVPVQGTNGVVINTAGRATDASSTLVSNGFFQLVTGSSGTFCTVTNVALQCPNGSPSTSIIADVLGRLQCQNSVSATSNVSANATFTISC